MKKSKSFLKKAAPGIEKGLDLALKMNANSTGCNIIYQPNPPKALRSFKKIK